VAVEGGAQAVLPQAAALPLPTMPQVIRRRRRRKLVPLLAVEPPLPVAVAVAVAVVTQLR
jgi:hypothetical protein